MTMELEKLPRPGGRLKIQKRADLVTEEIKQLITQKNLRPGDKLPMEKELQRLFSVSKSTIREALKSLEVQGLITISTGPTGGATIMEVPLERTFQLLQNYLFFKEVSMEDIYAARRLLEPELAAGSVPFLSDEQLDALEHNIETCQPTSQEPSLLVRQRQADLDFHDILAAANPNPFLRFACELINEMLRRLVVFSTQTPPEEHTRFGCANVKIHTEIAKAARARDSERVRALMKAHMEEASEYVKRLDGRLDGRLILDSEMAPRPRPLS
ncbi:GntR family transcriptional repressor for pyruvate dehydrogenase complex [Bradyrhizobium yuanmingense]|uniref:GntR family transcriptional repressor for pyruvate dehydrogenase complex n=3 Tax=Nitrobacteraceae TaxID=41294 RepID=A0ABV4GNK7_9BRAD